MRDFTLEQQRAIAIASARARAAQSEPDQIDTAPSSNTDVAINAANKGIASVPDMFLNAPNNLLNLGKAAVGTVAGAFGRPDLMPSLTPNPDLARRGLTAMGSINPDIQPQGGFQKGLDLVTQGVTGGAMTGGAGLPRVLAGAGMGALSAGSAGATEAVTGNPALAATAGLIAGGGKQAFTGTGKTPILKSGNQIQDATFAAGNAEGLKVPPSAMKSTWLGNRVEGLAGKAALGQQTAIENQPVVNKIARREASLPPETPISIDSLKAVREYLALPYKEVEALPGIPAKPVGTFRSGDLTGTMMSKTPKTPKQLVEDWKSNNSEITDLWNDYKQNHTVEILAKYKAARAQQGVIEKNIEEAAVKAGRPELVPQLRAARVALAKNYDVERALNLGNGNVDASVLGRMYDHGAPFTGGLQTIAKFQQAFPSSVREASKVPAPGVSKLEGYGALSLGLAGHVMAPGGGSLLAALPLTVSPASRALALSKYMQGGRQRGSGILANVGGQVSPVVTQGILAELQRQQANQ